MTAAAHAIRPLISAETIARRVEELAQEIAASSLDNLIIVAVLKGSFIFAADLIRALHRQGLAPEIDFIFLASYGAGTASSGEVRILRDVESELQARDVVIVDDIPAGRWPSPGRSWRRAARGGCGPASSSTRRSPARRRSRRTSPGFSARRSSWWATAWTSRTTTASTVFCDPFLGCFTTPISNHADQWQANIGVEFRF